MTPEQRRAIETHDDRAMMLHPDWWPRHPVLMLRRHPIRYPAHAMPQTGVLVMDGPTFCVRQFNYDNPLELLPEVTAYELVDDVLAAGWIVD